MPEHATEPNAPFPGTPPGSQQSFLLALIGKKVYVALVVPGAHQVGILRGIDASTITLEIAPEDTTLAMPMLIFKTGILTITPA